MIDIIITRNKGWFGRIRTALIMADDKEIGKVKSGDTVNVQIPDQTQNLYVKMDWGKSLPYSVQNIKNGQKIFMNAWFTFNPFRNIGIMPIPVLLEDEPR